MAMDMLEFEIEGITLDAIAARAESSLFTIDGALDRTFLLKKMEVEFMVHPGISLSGSIIGIGSGLLVFYHDDGITADAEAALDAALHDRDQHNDIIWSQNFLWSPLQVDDASGWALPAIAPVFKRTKSFTKGYPLSKDDIYTFRVVNVSEALTFPDPTTESSDSFLRVRMWGVYL